VIGRFHFADLSHPIQIVGVAFVVVLMFWTVFRSNRSR